MLFLQKKYASAFASTMQNSTQVDSGVWNFRCPVCGDSDKDPHKARGYIYTQSQDLFYKCHNCGDSRHISSLLKEYDPAIYKQYIAELFKHQRHPANEKRIKKENKILNRNTKKVEKRLSQNQITRGLRAAKVVPVSQSERAVEYLKSRQLPEECFEKIYFAENYKTTVSLLKRETPDTKYSNLDMAAIAFLLYDDQHRFSGIQFRALSKEAKKRFHIHKIRKSVKKLYFGNQYLEGESPKFIFEGVIDSLFLEKSVAALSSDLTCPFDSEETIYVLDFDNRNKQIVAKYKKLLEEGKTVCIPDTKYSHMDVNDLIIQGHTKQQIEQLILDGAVSGLSGLLRLSEWKRI